MKVISALVVLVMLPSPAAAQLKVITSGGFQGAYELILPDFERVTGIKVITGTGSSQGTGPQTIGAQLRRGEAADVVIMSREGLDELIAERKIVPGSDVNVAQTKTGLAVRSGARKPDISTVEAFKRTLMASKAIAIGGSTSGIDLTKRVFPQLGIDQSVVKPTARGAESVALVASGEADFALQPISELIRAPGVDLVGPIPEAVQFTAMMSSAIVKGTAHADEARRLLAFLTSPSVGPALESYGMQPPVR